MPENHCGISFYADMSGSDGALYKLVFLVNRAEISDLIYKKKERVCYAPFSTRTSPKPIPVSPASSHNLFTFSEQNSGIT